MRSNVSDFLPVVAGAVLAVMILALVTLMYVNTGADIKYWEQSKQVYNMHTQCKKYRHRFTLVHAPAYVRTRTHTHTLSRARARSLSLFYTHVQRTNMPIRYKERDALPCAGATCNLCCEHYAHACKCMHIHLFACVCIYILAHSIHVHIHMHMYKPPFPPT